MGYLLLTISLFVPYLFFPPAAIAGNNADTLPADQRPEWKQAKRVLSDAVTRYTHRLGKARVTIELDKQALPHCDRPVAVTLSDKERPVGRISLTIECHQPHYWKSRLRSKVSVSVPLVSAKTTLSRNHTLSAADLSVSYQDITYLRHGYFTERQSVEGKLTRRRINAGKVITPRMLTAQVWVERNQQVQITARRNGFSATMMGIALEEGSDGEIIRVRNLTSGKEIHVRVVGPQQVETQF